MKKILVIGNSFGTDATHYLYGIARADKVELKVVNLYIGGCSLYRHYRNMLSGAPAYSYEINGHTSGLFVSLSDALLSDEWNIVVLQQCSPDSDKAGSYEPYLTELAAFVRKHAPKADLWIHQTWTFAPGSPRFRLAASDTPEVMLPILTDAYRAAADRISAKGIIPSGDAMYRAYQEVAPSGGTVYRDTFHADYGFGRYLLSLVWYQKLLNRDASQNTFRDFDKEVTEEEVALAKRISREAIEGFGTLSFPSQEATE